MKSNIARAGFSLIEVNLAIFIIAIGMLTLFSLFPTGLRQAESAHESTQEALFAEDMLSTMRAVAMGVEEATTWTEKTLLLEKEGFADVTDAGEIRTLAYPPDQTNQYMRYVLELKPPTDAPKNWAAELWCSSGEFGSTSITNFKARAEVFYAEFNFSGMP